MHCFDGFAKQILSKIWNVFHDPLFIKSFYGEARPPVNPMAVEIHKRDLTLYFSMVKKHTFSPEAQEMLSINAEDSLLQIKPV